MTILLLGTTGEGKMNKPNPFDFIAKNHFIPNLPLEEAKALFKQSVEKVEIEVFSYCNRKCWFCPNSFIDRQSENIYMDELLYRAILQDLKSIEYDKTISYSRYNEPLADRVILTRLKQAQKCLPNALLHLNTNGDYLGADLLKQLYDCGLRSINIQVYLDSDEEYSDNLVRLKIMARINRLGLDAIEQTGRSGLKMNCKLEYKDMSINIYARNFESTGCDRGGLLEICNADIRTSPCLSPFKEFIIDYNGSVMPCCNLRSDSPAHEGFIISNIQKDNIFNIYTSKEAVSWRKKLIGRKPKQKPCDRCRFSEFGKKTVETL